MPQDTKNKRGFISELQASTIFVKAETVQVKGATAIFWKTQECMNHKEAVASDHSCLQHNVYDSQEAAQSIG